MDIVLGSGEFPVHTTAGSTKLEHGWQMIYAGVHSFCDLRLRTVGHVPELPSKRSTKGPNRSAASKSGPLEEGSY